MAEAVEVEIEGRKVRLTNLDKVFWPEGYTKADLIKYYIEMAPLLLPYMKDRLFVMSRYPDGITGETFYQKDCPDYAPDWLETLPLQSPDSDKVVNYIVIKDAATLAWLANQACIELHIWLAKKDRLNYPDIAVFDLDPFPPATFKDVMEVAMLVREALAQFDLKGFPKTSGATGMHIFVPLEPVLTYTEVRDAVEFICRRIHGVYPRKTTLERSVSKRDGKVYLDYLQNTRGKTMVFQYSLRPEPGAPVSTPVTWEEVAARKIKPGDFNIKTISRRLQEVGDLYREFHTLKQSLSGIFGLSRR